MTDCDWPIKSQIQTTSLIRQKCLECRNRKSNHQKLYTFECKYRDFHTVNRLETLGVHLYSLSLHACSVLGKSEI